MGMASVRATLVKPPGCVLGSTGSTASHPRLKHPKHGQVRATTATLSGPAG